MNIPASLDGQVNTYNRSDTRASLPLYNFYRQAKNRHLYDPPRHNSLICLEKAVHIIDI